MIFVEGRKEGASVGNADGFLLGSIEGFNMEQLQLWDILQLTAAWILRGDFFFSIKVNVAVKIIEFV